MRTSKPISTISFNTVPYLRERLDELIRNHKISDFMFITHKREEDEKKDHTHVFIKPNTLIDTMDIQKFLTEIDPNNPSKPLKCLDFRPSNPDDWILYCQHYEPYLLSKGETRKYHYLKEDFVFFDEDNFDDLYNHAFKGSDWAKRNQILEQLTRGQLDPVELITNGTVPLQQATQIQAFMNLKLKYSGTTFRGSHTGHEE